jgi:peptidoglycan/LPS O-acetylase OafA/YrhL
VLAVLAFHERFSGLPGGFLGVDIFFVISGYLITDLLAAPWDQGGRLDLRGFWLRRARRLLPPLAVVLVTVTAAVAVLEPDQLPVLRPALLAAVTYTSNWWQIAHHQSYFAAFGPPPPLQHLWSLAIEEQFYLIWPLLLTVILCARRTRRARARVTWLAAAASALAMAIGYAVGADPSRVYYGTDTHASALLVGAALALTWPLRELAASAGSDARRRDLAGLIGGTVLLWEMARLSGADADLYLGGMTLAALAAGSVVVAAAGPGAVSDVLAWAPLRWAGVRSYGIYLWHWPVIALFAARAGQRSGTFGVRVAETGLSIGLAAASWRWIEAPILRDGLRGTLRAYGAAMAGSAAAGSAAVTRQAPRRVLLPLIPLVAVAMTCTAGYGMLYSPPGQTLQQQLAAGSRQSGASRSHPGGAAAASRPDDTAQGHDSTAGNSPVTAAGLLTRGRRQAPGADITAIGDSVMLASTAQLRAALPGIYIDARVGMQMSAGLTVVRRLAAAGALRPILVIGLGTNGTVAARQVRALLALAGPRRSVVLITTYVPRPWQGEVNEVDAAAARRHRNVVLANWFTAIRNRTGLLWEDGVHPRPAGAARYARMIRAAVHKAARQLPRPAPPAQAAGLPSWRPPGHRPDR